MAVRVVALTAAAAGLYFLLREVWLSHQSERHQSHFKQLERISTLMAQGRWMQAHAQLYRLDDGEGLTTDLALQVAGELGDDQCREAVQAAWDKKGLGAQMDAALDRWMALAAFVSLTRRRWKLGLGTGLIVTGLLLQVAGLFAERQAPLEVAVAPLPAPTPISASDAPAAAPPLVAADVNEPTPVPPAGEPPRTAPVAEPTPEPARPPQESATQPAPEPPAAQEPPPAEASVREATPVAPVTPPGAAPKNESTKPGKELAKKKEPKELPRRSIRFDPGQASLSYTVNGKKVNLTEAVCAIKKELLAEKPASVLVIARADMGELSQSLKQKYDSKTAFAQARADVVAQFLSAKNECGAGLAPVATSITKPSRGIQDRMLQVFGTPASGSPDTARK